ncbi:hypothetical protein Psuf_084780 [Phytohabitans suffuscus]|uniref:Uncharacterized protein n=1 Tax=Phytohabitans suffuscus TaxID=624315 RepID=A0A6F8YYB8_9ACTN|nr:hypothetical protein Psuf_084780 [Phytohabitans suffuscus]
MCRGGRGGREDRGGGREQERERRGQRTAERGGEGAHRNIITAARCRNKTRPKREEPDDLARTRTGPVGRFRRIVVRIGPYEGGFIPRSAAIAPPRHIAPARLSRGPHAPAGTAAAGGSPGLADFPDLHCRLRAPSPNRPGVGVPAARPGRAGP